MGASLKQFYSIFFLLISLVARAQQTNSISDSTKIGSTTGDSLKKDTEIIKTGKNVVPLPDFRADPYVGYRLGGFIFIYDYGDGARYPNFYKNTEIEASYGSKGVINTGVKHKRYGDQIILAELKYQDQKAAPFFGFNGYQTVYNHEFADVSSTMFLSPKNTYFYNINQRNVNLNIEVQDTLKGSFVNWLIGAYSAWYDIKSVNTKRLNKGLDSGTLGYINEQADNLYNLYKKWGIIDAQKTEGGKFYTTIKGELIYDKRERITNPFKGILSKVGLSYTPKLGKKSEGNTVGLNASHTHYLKIIKNRLSFMFRIKYQGYFGGIMPFVIQEGLGGIKSAWGVHQNRALVRQWISGQFEPRLRAFSLRLFKQNFDFWGGPFFHTGYVIQEQKLNLSTVSDAERALFFEQNYGRWYSSYGHMGKMVINKNVALGLDFAFPVQASAGQPFNMFLGLNFSCMY